MNLFVVVANGLLCHESETSSWRHVPSGKGWVVSRTRSECGCAVVYS